MGGFTAEEGKGTDPLVDDEVYESGKVDDSNDVAGSFVLSIAQTEIDQQHALLYRQEEEGADS